jgi:hypothetical protein
MVRKWAKRLLMTVLVVSGLSAGVWLWHVDQRTEFFEHAVPDVFETAGLAIAGDDGSPLLALVVPWPIGMCGGAIFHLSQDTLDKIDKLGLAFFDNARKARGYIGTHRERHYTYAPWQKSPIPPWVGNKWDQWWGLDCIATSSDLPQRVGQEARKSGSYYTSKNYTRLVVVPSLRVIAVTFHPNE